MSVLIRNGWEIYFHRQLFGKQRQELRERVKKLKAELPEAEYLSHPDVKLLAVVMIRYQRENSRRSDVFSVCLNWFVTAIRQNERDGTA
jgi:3-phenylpropionate/cinnamic acid dioxygenase small subunit